MIAKVTMRQPVWIGFILLWLGVVGGTSLAADPETPITLNLKAEGYRGIWYMNQPSGDEYVYKYSGGLGTYCAKHRPFAIYRQEVEKTFFCYGGTTPDSDRELLHMVSYYDHRNGMVPRPTLLLNKHTDDAHDNPVISIDAAGYIWIFSTSHGRERPSYIHRSHEPYSIESFERITPLRSHEGSDVPFDNFSYMQAWHAPGQGFLCFFTRYRDPAQRTSMFMSSRDGIHWDPWQRLAAIDEGHYQISELGRARAGTAFNYHPRGKGLNWRTNLYYLETTDGGRTWNAADGRQLDVPITAVDSPALIHDYAAEQRNVYLKDICYDEHDRPIILYLTSGGYAAGPENAPRIWTTARWTGTAWDIRPAMQSDNNYDMGSLWLEPDGVWKIIAPTAVGPQPYNPGGEVTLWTSRDQGQSWQQDKSVTHGSRLNHTYVRRPLNAHPDFYAFWADGHGRQPSSSRLYFCNAQGDVRVLPTKMQADYEEPQFAD